MSSTRISTSSAMANTSTLDDDVLMTKEHKEIFREYRDQLVDNMYPDDLLNQLQAARVLSHRESSRIKEKGSAEAMNEALLDILIRKPDRAFSEFLNALRESDQNHVANIIDKNKESTPKHKRDQRKNIDLSDGEGDGASPTTSRKRKIGEIGVRLKTERLEFAEEEDEDEEVETPRRKVTRRLAEAREAQKEELKQELDLKLLSIIKKELRNLETVVGSGISESAMAKRRVVMDTLKDLQKYRREITSVDYGSVLFRLVCPTLYSLLQLQTLCTSGRLASLAEKIFTFDDFREHKLRKVHLSVSMDPAEFDLCQKELERKENSTNAKITPTNDQENDSALSFGEQNRKNRVSSSGDKEVGKNWTTSSAVTEDLCLLRYISLSSPPHKSSDLEDWAEEALPSLTRAQHRLLSPSRSTAHRTATDIFRSPLRPDGRGRSPHRRSVRRLDDPRRLRHARAAVSLSPLPGHQRAQVTSLKASRSQPGRLTHTTDIIITSHLSSSSSHTQPNISKKSRDNILQRL